MSEHDPTRFLTFKSEHCTADFLTATARFLRDNNIQECHRVRVFITKDNAGNYTNRLRIDADDKVILRILSKKITPLNNFRSTASIPYIVIVQKYLKVLDVPPCYMLRVFMIKDENGAFTTMIRVRADKKTIAEDIAWPHGTRSLELLDYGRGIKKTVPRTSTTV